MPKKLEICICTDDVKNSWGRMVQYDLEVCAFCLKPDGDRTGFLTDEIVNWKARKEKAHFSQNYASHKSEFTSGFSGYGSIILSVWITVLLFVAIVIGGLLISVPDSFNTPQNDKICQTIELPDGSGMDSCELLVP